MLSAVLTFGLYVAGHFNADLKNFDKSSSRSAAIWLARGIYHVLPDLSAFDVKTEVVHGLPVPLGYLASTAPTAWRTSSRSCSCRRSSFRGGTSSERRAATAVVLLLAQRAFAGAIALQMAAGSLRTRATISSAEQMLYVRSGAALKRLTLVFDALAADVYWIRAIQHYGGDRLSGPQAADRSTSCSTRCSISPRRSIRTSTSPTGSARSS